MCSSTDCPQIHQHAVYYETCICWCASTFHLKDSDDWFLHTSAGQEFQHTLPFCQDELEHLRRTWASLSQWSEWRLHTGDLTDVSLARNVLVCNDGQPALPPLFWALIHQLLHQQGLDNGDTSEEEKAVICLRNLREKCRKCISVTGSLLGQAQVRPIDKLDEACANADDRMMLVQHCGGDCVMS